MEKSIDPLYSIEDVKESIEFFHRVYYDKLEDTGKGLKYMFRDAGHILGSASLEIWFHDGQKEKKIVFSEDIGRKGNPIVRDPKRIEEADYIVIESTYGNRLHKGLKETIDEFVKAIKVTFKKGGNVLIPPSQLEGPRTSSISSIISSRRDGSII